MKMSLFDYTLPLEKIAHEPIEPREEAKMLVLDRNSGEISDSKIKDLVSKITKNDVLVFNKTKVIPAKLLGEKPTGGKVEVLLVKPISENTWEALSRPGLREGQKLNFGPLMAEVVGRGNEIVKLKFNYSGDYLMSRIYDLGRTPLPPYIKSDKTERELRRTYQTVYAQTDGSVAAPTAGLHFSRELMLSLPKHGIQMEYLTLHIGLGTFRPVKTEEIEDHKMHSERFVLDEETVERLNRARTEGKRIIAIGTTVARVLEACSNEKSELHAASGETEIFIFPPYKFKFVDAMLTNFHLPKSTLLMLVSALVSFPNTKKKFVDFGQSLVGKAYKHAIENDYRFFSFGDAMLIE